MFAPLTIRLQETVRQHPGAEALVHGSARINYRALWTQVLGVSAFFRREGLAPQARVALLLENSIEYVIAYYGVLAAGGAVVALNTAAKATDLGNWLSHSATSWLILDSTHPEAGAVMDWCRGRLRVIVLDGAADGALSWREITRTSPAADVAPVREGDLAAIIYTSGTTGNPKGVMLNHANLACNVESILAYLHLTASDRVLNVLPFYYSYGNSVLHTHLAVGGCVVIEDNLVYPHRVLQRMSAERATGFSGVPSTFALLLSRVRFEDYDLASLRYLTQAGGPMPPANIQRLLKALPHVRLFVMYGQTEATARLSYLPPERLHDKLGSIGVAIPGVVLEVRGDSGETLGPGAVGEIWARGGNIMSGYWNDPEATRQVLADGWLRTGDLAYRDAEGYFYIQGRKSDMIKSGAHRIHPQEIEELIAELHDVAEVAVIGVDDEILGQVVKAYIVPKPGATLDVMHVKAHCHKRLATYKIPKYVELVSELPKTTSGKIRKHLLASGVQQTTERTA
jgi:long-chain acyl-CoA synthetase